MRRHGLHPEKTWFDARGPGFDSPQLHNEVFADWSRILRRIDGGPRCL